MRTQKLNDFRNAIKDHDFRTGSFRRDGVEVRQEMGFLSVSRRGKNGETLVDMRDTKAGVVALLATVGFGAEENIIEDGAKEINEAAAAEFEACRAYNLNPSDTNHKAAKAAIRNTKAVRKYWQFRLEGMDEGEAISMLHLQGYDRQTMVVL